MKRGPIYFFAAALLIAAIVVTGKPLTNRISRIAADLKLIGSDTGDVMASATYQRFQARREAVAAMQADLRWLARAESRWARAI